MPTQTHTHTWNVAKINIEVAETMFKSLELSKFRKFIYDIVQGGKKPQIK